MKAVRCSLWINFVALKKNGEVHKRTALHQRLLGWPQGFNYGVQQEDLFD